ncbi:hypothetical protein F4604DRAFT_1933099 [Suillus subluteus]|nr:hypothetical protein F4604DRAFT_1933057 [Suillus subluteus]KAG1853673.1 hypothetical protein F4604DRAFT_1933099 [Suillus subluteus]
MPDDRNFKYLNEKYQGKSDDERYAETQGLQSLFEDRDNKNFVCVQYALGVLHGKYQDHTVFTGLVDAMVNARETKRAIDGVRTQLKNEPEDMVPTENSENDAKSIRHRIYLSTPGGQSGEHVASLAGNSANAEMAAGQRALTLFTRFHVPRAPQLSDALVGVTTDAHPHHLILTPGKYGIVLIQKSQSKTLRIGFVLDEFSQFIHKVVVRQAHTHGSQTLETPALYLTLLCKHSMFSFARVLCDSFLCVPPGTPSLTPDGRTLSLSEDAFRIFADIKSKQKQVELAVKALKAARRKGKKKGADGDDEE